MEKSAQTRAVDDDEVLAHGVGQVLERVVEVALVEQEVAGLEDMVLAVERHLEPSLGHVEMFLDAAAMAGKRPRARARRQPVENEIDAAAEIERRQRAPLEAAFVLTEDRLLVGADMHDPTAARAAADQLRDAEIEGLGEPAQHGRGGAALA